MVVEGKGRVAPAPIQVHLSRIEINQIIDGVRTGLNRYGARIDGWGKGLLSGIESEFLRNVPGDQKPAVAGKCGEYALWVLASRRLSPAECPPVDFTRLSRGDGGIDLRLGGSSIQVKTRLTSRTNLIRHTNSAGIVQVLAGDAFVFCKWDGALVVDVLGWIRTRDIPSMPLKDSPRGDWTNFDVSDSDLFPMSRLWAELAWRRTA